jgi:nucleotide-binding universal stress UspA family protein
VPTIVVAVVRHQPAAVLEEAASFARRLGAHLMCATVDPSRITLERRTDGTVLTASIDPDRAEESVLEFDPHLKDQVTTALEPLSVPYTLRALAGAPSAELTVLAEEVDALMIVVGTRETGVREAMREFFTGSVAVQLAHHQHRPVLMIPLDPTGPDAPLPGLQTA